jgi:hypothetical protein
MSKVNPEPPAPQEEQPPAAPKRTRLWWWAVTAFLLAALICFVVLYAVEKTKDDDEDGTCSKEDEAMEECMLQDLDVPQQFDCMGCIMLGMSEILKTSVASCPVIEEMLCTTLSTCPCGPCRDEILESLNCELQAEDVPCLIDCNFSTLPTPAPTSPPPNHNSTTLLTTIVRLSAAYLSQDTSDLF